MRAFEFLGRAYELYDPEDVPARFVPGYVYARQSVTRDGSESLPAQLDVCFEAAPRLRIAVVDVFVEPPSTSGYKNRGRERAKFKELLAALENGPGRCVLTFKSDRLSRGGGPGWAPLFDVLDGAGINPDRAVATPSGWMSEFEIGIRATTDREESKKTSERMLLAREREAKEGRPRIGGRRPYGYTQRYEVIVEEKAIVAEAAQRTLAGESTWSIVNDFNLRGVPTVTGTRWTVAVLKKILRHPRNVARRTFKGEIVKEHARWEPLLDVETWERVNALLDRAWPYPTKSRPRTYPLVGFLFCALCGAKLQSMQRENGGRTYACRKGPGLLGCGRLRIVAGPLEAKVKRLVLGTLTHPKYRSRLVALLGTNSDGEGDSLAEQLAEIAAKRELLVDLLLSKRLSRAEFNRRDDQLIRT
jgi:site-specific DNA recombinase